MHRYVAHKVLHALGVAFGVLTLAFLALRLSGDPAAMMVPPDASLQDIQAWRHELGLDVPLPAQYVRFVGDTLQGNFGTSFKHGVPAWTLVTERMWATGELALVALGLALAIGIPVGIIASLRRGSWYDALAMAFAVFGQATPYFWLGLMLILVFSVRIPLFPTGGRGDWHHLVLPGLTLGAFFAASVARLTRSCMLEVLGTEYILTARAKGLGERLVILKHALKNALIPVVTLIGLHLGSLLGGAVVTETIFAWPGVGRLIIFAISYRDYPVVQAAVFLLAMIFVGINLAVDLLYGVLDPRVRVE
jgi:peptide/nickel transport system permease protein